MLLTYQRAKTTTNTLDKYVHEQGLPINVVGAIKHDYERLTDRTMLAKCLHGLTQNVALQKINISWTPHSSIGCDGTLLHFNLGNTVLVQILKEFGVEPGKYTVSGTKAHAVRLRKSFLQNTPEQKQCRRVLRGIRKKGKEMTSKMGATYCAGQF